MFAYCYAFCSGVLLSKHSTTSLYRCQVDTVYMTWVTWLCNNGLDCYLASPEVWKCSAFDRPQGFRDKANFTGKMASRRDGLWRIKIPGFFCPAGTYGMYANIFIALLISKTIALIVQSTKFSFIILFFLRETTDIRNLQSRTLNLHETKNWITKTTG